MSASSIDIVICTYDREELLCDCLRSLQVQDTGDFKIYLVNNNKSGFSETTSKLIDSLTQIETIHHTIPGLSEARNAGIKKGTNHWIAFLDDDAKVGSDYVRNIHEVIKQEQDWACFGGGIKSWWKYGRPRWLLETFGEKPHLSDVRKQIKEDYNWGSNIIIKRSALEAVGGFPADIGMKGNRIGYAAENIVQMKLREQGHIIGYDPDLVIHHVIAKHKLKLSWHINSSYATGRDGKKVFPDQYGPSGMMRSLKSCITKPLKGVRKLLLDRDYFIENLYLDVAQPVTLLIGKCRAFLPL